ncbi:MAG TPA: YkgJ family cysteine cluster protein [Stellaceae bacterium]|nr:YkgJ family cysteine cluster protein [Stellaceae bacterium]
MSERRSGDDRTGGTAAVPLALARPLAPLTRFALPPEIGDPTPEVLGFLAEIAEETRALTRALLLQASAAGEIETALQEIGNRLAAEFEARLAHERAIDPAFASRERQVECRRGCTFCCHLNVSATPLEAARIWSAMRRGTKAGLERSVFSAAAALEGLDGKARLERRAPCPLLVDSACSLYEMRPLACRALLSVSVRDCERHFEAGGAALRAMPSLLTPRLVASGILSGEMAALADLGLASHLVELTAALALLLREPQTLRRWLGGADVFRRP